jgi:PAS domain S-box-containing protein
MDSLAPSSLLASVLATSQDAVIATDAAGRITVWNRAAQSLYGIPADAAIGQLLSVIVPVGHHDEHAALEARLHEGDTVQDALATRRHAGGRLLAIRTSAAPLRTDDGAIVGYLRIEREDVSRDDLAPRRLAALVEWSDDAIVSKDLDGIVTSWNAAAERMFGYTAEEMIGQSIRRIIPADRQAEEDDVLAHLRRGERVEHFETVRRRKDRSAVSISLSVSPIRDASGQVVGASKIARDVTERQRLQKELERLLGVTRQVAAIGAALAATLDRDAIVQQVTDAATELTTAEFGAFFYNVSEPGTGESYMLYTLSGAPKEAFARFPQPRATQLFGPTFRGEGVVRLDDVTTDARYGRNPPYAGMPSGHLPVRSYLAVPVKSTSGEVLGGLFFGHSRVGVFTEEHELLVTGIASWASVALQNAHLYVAASEANRLKDEFLAVLSHELRTPLNAILGYARLLRGGVLAGDKAARGLETLERNAVSLTQIVEDVLDVSRIVAGRVRLDVQPVELSLVVHNAVSTIQPAADAKQVRIQTTIDPRVGMVSGDPDRLQQVVWNLLSNAVKFTPKGGRVQVRLQRVNSHVEIVVSDTGIGIKPEFLPHVFERFRQAEAGTTRKTGGLGLGLAIVRHIVEMHGGSVHAASTGEGQGATFYVRFPLMIVAPPASGDPRQHPLTERVQPLRPLEDLQAVRVLAVDDEPDAQALLRSVLEAAGAEVFTLASADEALAQIGSVQPDVLIVDIGMPDVDGLELIRRIRRSSEAAIRDVPAAALTAFARSEDRTNALRAGFEIHLAKPVDPGELAAAVATLVRRHRTPRPE